MVAVAAAVAVAVVAAVAVAVAVVVAVAVAVAGVVVVVERMARRRASRGILHAGRPIESVRMRLFVGSLRGSLAACRRGSL